MKKLNEYMDKAFSKIESYVSPDVSIPPLDAAPALGGGRGGKALCDGTFRIELLINLRSYLIKENTNENSAKV